MQINGVNFTDIQLSIFYFNLSPTTYIMDDDSEKDLEYAIKHRFAEYGFLDFSTRGDTGDYYELDYLRVRNGHSGKGVSRQLVEELYSSVLKDGDTISWGKMMNEKVSHLLKSMQELYPHIDSFGAEWY